MNLRELNVVPLFLFILSCETIQAIEANSIPTAEDSTKSIVDFWRQQEDEFKMGSGKDIVLLLGNTGCGKSTTASLLSNVELESIETFPDSKQFVLIDKYNRISKPNETITSKTLVPELISDAQAGVAYYDCPGFEDTRSVKHDIAITYSIKKLLDFSKSVKLVFLVNYASVKVGGSRNDFINLAEHATTLIKNIDKFRDGIALIVTKVEHRYVWKNGTPVLIDDQTEINGIAHFLQQAKDEIEKNRNQLPLAEQRTINEKNRFIDVLLTKSGNRYNRIGIVRLSNETGLIKDMPWILEEKQYTNEMINRNLQYIRKDYDDFGLTITDKSKARVLELLDEMKNHLNGIAANIDQEIKQFYVQQEQQSTNIKSMYSKALSIYQTFQVPKSKEARLFLQQTTKIMSDLGINDTSNHLNKFSNGIKLIDFLKEVSGRGRNVTIEIDNGLKKAANYLDETRKWYNFLINLHPIVSTFGFRNEVRTIFTKLTQQSSMREGEEIKLTISELKQLVNQAGSRIYNDVEDLPVNSFKVNALKQLVLQALKENVILACAPNKLIVKGVNVKISDVMKANCYPNSKYIEIFALNRLFVDVNVDVTGRQVQLSIIASAWEVVGDRQIVLNGQNAQSPWNRPAENARANWENGRDGAAGLPGGSAGHFFGVGKFFFNGPHLKISADGGMGGAGQAGGNGAPGERLSSSISDYSHEELVCRTRGSNGGNGGVGGLGGIAGKVNVVGHLPPSFQISVNNGRNGTPEAGGSGAAAGQLEHRWTERKRLLGIVVDKKEHYEHWGGTHGENGRPGLNRNEIQQPIPVNLTPSASTVTSYKDYAREKLARNVLEYYIQDFLNDLK